jgi:hypothetical protein
MKEKERKMMVENLSSTEKMGNSPLSKFPHMSLLKFRIN